MKNKIKKFSKGDFRVVSPDIVFPERNLVITIGEGEKYKGSFVLKNKKEGEIRGLVYASSFRIHLPKQGFEGNQITIPFVYDGTGLKPGHVETGRFTIVCNGGEYDINFTVIIEKPYIMTSYGKVQNTRDFKKLALHDFTEAQRLFRSRDFYEVIKYEEPRIKALYENMRKWSLGEQAMEEFLVGIKQKERIFLTFDRSHRTFRNLKEATREIIHFAKNTWGYMPIKVHVDGEFIRIGRDNFSTDDFVGNQYDFGYIIQPEKLHAGNNYGKIVFETPYESLEYEITVTNHKNHNPKHREFSSACEAIIRGFLKTKSGEMTAKEWAADARGRLDEFDMYTGDGDLKQLINAHFHVLCDEYTEAETILESYNYNRFAIGRDPVVSAYYQYLTALVRRNGSHVNRVAEELNKAYMKQPRSWMLVCMLIDVDPEYKNYTKRLYVLERHFQSGANQSLLYWKALECFREHPASMKKLSAFELQIMNFALKYNLLTKEVALYMANLATQQRVYDKTLDKILRKTYEVFPDTQILTAICTMMIRGNCTESDDFKWYEMAVKEDLKIAQLYEYYMMSISEEEARKELPKTVYFYFAYGNTLNHVQAAILYANIIRYQDEASELYSIYREQIERFAWDQLRRRRINDTLRTIYKRCCRMTEMTEERLREMYDICHAYEVTTYVPNMAYVLVIEGDGRISQKAPYNPNGTTVFLYDKQARIVWESKDGRHYVDSISYETIRVFYESKYVELWKKREKENEDKTREKEARELTWEAIRKQGADHFNTIDVFKICSKQIRESAYEEDEDLVMFCYNLFMKDQYDTVTLTYLVEYFCGATADMKKIWKAAREFDITTYKLSERIITQMLFSEMMFGEEEIFADYYDGRTYFRLKQAYLAYVSREYVVNGRFVKGVIFAIIAKEYRKEEELPDICKIALLKYYSSREIHQGIEKMLRAFLREMCEKQLFFSFYLDYPEEWLREVQLYDKTMIEYHAKPGSKVTISYQIRKEGSEHQNYQHELLLPAYEDTYIKTLILFADESVRYYFTETRGEEVIVTDKREYEPEKGKSIGRYGRLNEMVGKSGEELEEAMREYAAENELAAEIFQAY